MPFYAIRDCVQSKIVCNQSVLLHKMIRDAHLAGMEAKVEYINYDKRNQGKIELLILILFSLYSVCMLWLSMEQEWPKWMTFLLFMNCAFSWGVHLAKYRDYRSRAIISTASMQISILLYAAREEDLSLALAVVVAFTIFAGLYGIMDLMYITRMTALVLMFYHVFVARTMQFRTMEDLARILLQVCNIFLVQYVVWIWVKNRDMTNGQFLETIENLRNVEQSKDDFLANVSHEIRTPINTIYGMSEMILREEDPVKVRGYVMDIRSAGRKLMFLVSDILDFSELQAGSVELENESYNITSTINDVIQMAMAKKSGKLIELIVDCDATLPSVLFGDEKKIRRVIMNLVDNAIKFTSEGYVSIEVGYRKESYGINLTVTVKDTGIGMSEESIEKLFASFNQVDTKRNRQEGGIGLGLAISQAIIQKMDGILTVRSKLGKGSSVKLVVPQEVLDDKPIVDIQSKEHLCVAVYLNMEQFEMVAIRDAYADSIRHMVEQSNVRCHVCRNLAELKRREEYEHFTHVFISGMEYKEDSSYFDQLAVRTKVAAIIDRQEENQITSRNILRVYKPLYILPIVSVLNDSSQTSMDYGKEHTEQFVAPGVHVLVVDDNLMNLTVVEALLENYRIKVSKATSGREALEMIKSMDYDFIFMDHMMPEMDGIETLYQIRKKVGTYYQKVPVIALTANAVAGMREKFLSEGFADFLEKPIERSVLERVLRRNVPQEKLLPISEDRTQTNERVTDSIMTDELTTDESVLNEMMPEAKVSDVVEEALQPEDPDLVEGLDLQTGLLYCGGRASYRKILMCHSQSGEENRKNIERLYQQQQWTEYTIAVHGVKSAMMSIGAVKLSEQAKALEMAGKADDIVYIRAHHDEMLAEYQRVLENIQKNPLYAPIEPKIESEQELSEMTEEMLDQVMKEIEAAMYELDGKRMEELVRGLEAYRYNGIPMKKPLAMVLRKIQMSDYMSAMDVLIKLRKQMQNQ